VKKNQLKNMDQGFQYECPTEETNRNVVLNDAVETNGIGENTSNSILLNVFTLTGSLTIETYLYYTVTQLKQQLSRKLYNSSIPLQRVYLIYRGRLLNDNQTLSSCGLQNGAYIHVHMQSVLNLQGREEESVLNSLPEESFPEHVEVGEIQEGWIDSRGFDRLRFFGLSEQEVQQIRVQFHNHRWANSGYLLIDTDHEAMNRLEDEWIDEAMGNSEDSTRTFLQSNPERMNWSSRLVPTVSSSTTEISEIPLSGSAGEHSVFPNILNNTSEMMTMTMNEQEHQSDSNMVGNNEDFFKGMLMGFLLGIIMLLWLRDKSLPLRMKIGILAGLGISISFALLKSIIHVRDYNS